MMSDISKLYFEKYGSRRIRVFLSSTFQDMQEERSYLVNHTFQAIKRLAEQRNVDFSVVDLRWGVTEEEAHQGKVIEICLNEIKETQPFFIGLVGDRYGWCPTMEDINKNSRLLNLFPNIRQYIEQGLSMTEIEMQYGVFDATNGVYANFFLKDSPSRPIRSTSKDEQTKLDNLRHKISLKANKGECSLQHYSSIEQLGDCVYKSLTALIEELYPEESKDEINMLVERQRYLLRQLQSNYENSEAREILNRVIFQLVVQMHAECYCIAITTKDHCVGKSALAANWGIKDANNIIRTILNKDDNNAEAALQHLRAEIQLRGLSTADRITWTIDGLDYLDNNHDRSLEWLMSDELKNIQFVLTANDKTILNNIKALCGNDKRAGTLIYIGDVNKNDAQRVVVTYLKQFAKGLSKQQINRIVQHPLFSQNVLLLKLFLNELTQFGSYENLDRFMQPYLNATTESQLIETILQRLEKDYGKETISSYFGLLSLTECGIADHDLQHIMGLTPIYWSALRSATSLFMDNLQSLVIINHRLRTFIKERYNNNPAIENGRRRILFNLYSDLILNLIDSNLLESNYGRYTQYNTEVIRQKIAIDGIGETFQRESYYMWIEALLDSEILSLFVNYINGSAERLHECLPDDIFSEYPLMHLVDICYSWLNGDAGEFADFVELTTRRRLPGKIQEEWEEACQLFLSNLMKQYDQNPEDAWITTPIDQLSLANFVAFEDQLILITDDKRISHIEENIDILIQRIIEIKTSYTKDILAQLYVLKCYCCYRHNNLDAMESYFAHAIHLNSQGYRKYSMLTFLVNLTLDLDIECNHIIQQVKQHAENQTDNDIRRKALGSLYTMQLLMAAHNTNEDLAMDLMEGILDLWPDNIFQAYTVVTWAAILLQINKDYLYAGLLYQKAREVAPSEDAEKICEKRAIMCLAFATSGIDS